MGRGTKNTTLQEENVVEPADSEGNTSDEASTFSESTSSPCEIEADITVSTCQRIENVFGSDFDTDAQSTALPVSLDEIRSGGELLETPNEVTHEGNVPNNSMLPNSNIDQCLYGTRHRCQSVITHSVPEDPADTDNTGRQMEQLGAFGKSRLVTSAEKNAVTFYLLSNSFGKRTYKTEPQEMFRRTFGVPTLIVKIEARPPDNDDTHESTRQPVPVWVSNDDEDCISRYLGTQGFRLFCRDENTLYFSVCNRAWGSANSEINRIQSELRCLCFGKFYGRNIGGRRVETPDDLLISFRLGGFDDSTWRFYFAFAEYRNTILIKPARPVSLVKALCTYTYICYILAFFMKFIKE